MWACHTPGLTPRALLCLVRSLSVVDSGSVPGQRTGASLLLGPSSRPWADRPRRMCRLTLSRTLVFCGRCEPCLCGHVWTGFVRTSVLISPRVPGKLLVGTPRSLASGGAS